MPVVIVPGEREVPTEPGFVPVARHEDVTLELLRSIGPLVPELPRKDLTGEQQEDPSDPSALAAAAEQSRAELAGAPRRPASQVLHLNRG